ncbi:MAG: DUF1788 domain-containing protein [Gemmatimonadetes bacterium]|nr:DUF1788 domain-containing protein [Gemmatimonadota bacterium]
MISSEMNALGERLVRILGDPNFLAMKGLANEVPIFIQTYRPEQEDALRRMVESLAGRLRNAGITVRPLDLFELVLAELEEHGILDELLEHEQAWEKADVLETLQNFSDPRTRLVPRLMRAIGDGETQLTLVTGSGRVYPFLRTHNLLESLQPAMLNHPIVIFFPGEYTQDPDGGSQLRLFGSELGPRIVTPYYRAANLDHLRI